MKQFFATVVMALLGGQAAQADDNRIFLLQMAPAAGPGNTMFVDQRRAQNSVVRGGLGGAEAMTPDAEQAPAVQYGSGNHAQVIVRATGSMVGLAQLGGALGSRLLPGDDNVAAIMVRGNDQTARLTQLGSGNRGEIDLRRGDGAHAALMQLGDDNAGDLQVRGADTTGTLIQNGSNIESALSVRAQGAHVTYRLNGSNIAASNGVVVVTNIGAAGPITITQSR